jgi:hypothetical protein
MSANNRAADHEPQRRASQAGPRQTQVGAPAPQLDPDPANRACRS